MEGATQRHDQKTLLLFFLLQLLFLCEERLNCGDHIRLAVVSCLLSIGVGIVHTWRFVYAKAVGRLMAPGESCP